MSLTVVCGTGLLRWRIAANAKRASRPTRHSNRGGYLAEHDGEPKAASLVGGDLVVAAAEVLDQRVTGGDHSQPGHGLDPARRAEAPLQLRVVGLDPVGRVPLDVVPRRRPLSSRTRG